MHSNLNGWHNVVDLHQNVKPNNHGDQWVDVLMLARPLPNLVLRGTISGGIISGGGGLL